jgi:putative membrane protein
MGDWYYGGYGPHMWGGHFGPLWFMGPIFGLLWVGLIIFGVWLIVRTVRHRGYGYGGNRARDILDERYARGELTSEEYKERLEQLK